MKIHPNPHKHKEISDQIHEIKGSFTDLVEYISLDEGYMDVTGSAALFGGAKNVELAIKDCTGYD